MGPRLQGSWLCPGCASLWSVGVFSNRFLLGGISVSLAFAALPIYLPPLEAFFGTEALAPAAGAQADRVAALPASDQAAWGLLGTGPPPHG